MTRSDMMGRMTFHAREERLALCQTFLEVGPDAPTLSGDWTTADLAAHLVLREGRPDLAAGIAIPLLAGRLERATRELARTTPFPELVARFREGPPAWSPARVTAVDDATNLFEFYVHHEDVLRASDRPRRAISDRLQAALWVRLRATARLMFRHAAAGAVLVTPEHGRVAAHGPTDLGTVVLRGAPSELVLVAYGRHEHAAVEAEGSPDAVEALYASRLGFS